MPVAKVSSKGWIVIPVEMRRKYGIDPGGEVRLVDYGGVVAMVPVLEEPVREARGLLKGGRSLNRDLLAARAKERKREEKKAGVRSR